MTISVNPYPSIKSNLLTFSLLAVPVSQTAPKKEDDSFFGKRSANQNQGNSAQPTPEEQRKTLYYRLEMGDLSALSDLANTFNGIERHKIDLVSGYILGGHLVEGESWLGKKLLAGRSLARFCGPRFIEENPTKMDDLTEVNISELTNLREGIEQYEEYIARYLDQHFDYEQFWLDLEKPENQLDRRAAHALSLTPSRSRGKLIGKLLEPETRSRFWAAKILIHTGPETGEELLALLCTESLPLSSSQFWSVGEVFLNWVDVQAGDQVDALMPRFLSKMNELIGHLDPEIRELAAKFILKARTVIVQPSSFSSFDTDFDPQLLFAMIYHEDPAVRQVGEEGLGHLPAQELSAVVDLLNDQNLPVYVLISACHAISNFFRDEDNQNFNQAYQTASYFRTPQAISYLYPLFRSHDPALAEAAKNAIESLALLPLEQNDQQVLKNWIRHAKPDRRHFAALVLGNQAVAKIEDRFSQRQLEIPMGGLEELLKDKEPFVREAAIESIEKIKRAFIERLNGFIDFKND